MVGMNLSTLPVFGASGALAKLIVRILNGEPGAIAELVIFIACLVLFIMLFRWWRDR
jgi:hypothetical protein